MAPRSQHERGSVMPLILAMVAALLFISAGITAATSAFLAKSNLQSMCDGAAAVASETIQHAALLGHEPSDSLALAAARDYLIAQGEMSTAISNVTVGVGSTAMQCLARAPITFGAIFGKPEIELTVDTVGLLVLP